MTSRRYIRVNDLQEWVNRRVNSLDNGEYDDLYVDALYDLLDAVYGWCHEVWHIPNYDAAMISARCSACGKRLVDCECDFKAGHLTTSDQEREWASLVGIPISTDESMPEAETAQPVTLGPPSTDTPLTTEQLAATLPDDQWNTLAAERLRQHAERVRAMYDESAKSDLWATVDEGGICPNPSPGIKCPVCGSRGSECHADKVHRCAGCGRTKTNGCSCPTKE